MKKILLSLACMTCIGACNATPSALMDDASATRPVETSPAVKSNAPATRAVKAAAPDSHVMQALQQARVKWNAKLKSGHYIYTLEHSPAFNKPLRIRVKDGEVVQVMTVPDNISLPASRSEQVLTVSDLFIAASTELESSDQVNVVYDTEYGFPKLITISGVAGSKYKASGMRLLD